MPALRNLLIRAASTRHGHTHKLLGEDEYSDDGSLGKEMLSSSTKRSATDGSFTETSVESYDESNPVECDRLDKFDIKSKYHRKPLAPGSPVPEKQSLDSFLNRDRAMTSTSTSRSVIDKRTGRASKGRSRRIQRCDRSVVSLPTRSTAPNSPAKSMRESIATSSNSLTPRLDNRSSIGSSISSNNNHSASKSLPRSSPSPRRFPQSAPTGRKQKVALRHLPRAPVLSGSNTLSSSTSSSASNNDNDDSYRSHMTPRELYNRKAKSTRELLKEYNNILDEFDDSTRGPRSKTVDLLEEYDEILTEYDDSARADRNTPYSTGWR